MERQHNRHSNQRFPPPSEYDRYAVKLPYPESGQGHPYSQKPPTRNGHNNHAQTDGSHHYVPSGGYPQTPVNHPEDPRNNKQQVPHWEHSNNYPQHPASYQGYREQSVSHPQHTGVNPSYREQPVSHPQHTGVNPSYREQPVSHPQHTVVNPSYHAQSKNHPEPLMHPEYAANHKGYPLNYQGQQTPHQDHLVMHEQDPRFYGKPTGHPEQPGMNQGRPNTYHEPPINHQGQHMMHQPHIARQEHNPLKYHETVISHPEHPGTHHGRPLTYNDLPLNLEKMSLQDQPGSYRQQPIQQPMYQPEYSASNRENPTIQQENRKSIPEYSMSNREALGSQANSGSYMVHPLSLQKQHGIAYRKSSLPENPQVLHNSNNNTYPERGHGQRSKSHHRTSSIDPDTRIHRNENENKPVTRSPSNVRDARRPILPQVEYGSRSNDTDVYAIPNRNGQQGGPEHYRAQHKAQKAKKPRIPKPDYTWHKKMVPNFDYEDSD